MSFKKKSLILSLSRCTIKPRQQLTSGCMPAVIVKTKFFNFLLISLFYFQMRYYLKKFFV